MEVKMPAGRDEIKTELYLAKRKWPGIGHDKLSELRQLVRQYRLSVHLRDVEYFEGRLYVTHAGLLRLARRNKCAGISTSLQTRVSEPSLNRWVFKATVFCTPSSRGFVGYGDADPSNVSGLVHGAEMRVAETRAVNRALRKAYGIGLCSVEESDWMPKRLEPRVSNTSAANNGHPNGQPRLRDRLCLLIREHHLDAALVKAYAADYCGAPALRDASRESVEAFIAHLAEEATNNRDALLCRLNSYSRTEEAHS
jgi:hypothetical protein